MKLIVLSSVMAVALGTPEATAEADAHFGQHQWPGAYGVGSYGHGFSSTCYGCRPYGQYLGKRSADADADAHYGGAYRSYGGLYGGYGLGLGYARGYGYVGRTIYGYPSLHHGKRSAEPHGVVGHVHSLGVAGHPGHATSYVGRTIYGYPSLHHGKRSADAEPTPEADADAHYGAYGYGGYGHGISHGYGLGHAYGYTGGYTRVSGLSHHGPYAYSYGLSPHLG